VPLGKGFSRVVAAAMGFSFSAISVVSRRGRPPCGARLDDPETLFAHTPEVVVIGPIGVGS
jgi:hypothetical protein